MPEVIPESWVMRIFKRLTDIYTTYTTPETISQWQNILGSVTANQIKYALQECRNNPEMMPNATMFAELCKNYTDISDNTHSDSCAIKAPIGNLKSYEVIPLQWPKNKPQVKIEAIDDDWKAKLMAMDDMQALETLSRDKQYERSRLLLAKEGQDMVSRYQRS